MKSIKVSPTGFFILFLCLLTTEIFSQQIFTTERTINYTEQELQSLFLGALATLSEEKIPLQYRSLVAGKSKLKCPTFLLLEAKRNLDFFSPDQQSILKQIFIRPQLPLSYVNASGQFKIHYATSGRDSVSVVDINGNGTPDFVDEVAASLVLSFQMQVNDFGYREPPDDAGVDGPEYDIYIQSLGSGVYGETFAEEEVAGTARNDFRSYFRIDNNFNNGHFTTGVPGAQVTIAHEYLHAIQFGYRTFETNDEIFYYELSSIWMEDVVYDDINDYYQYLPGYFQLRNSPFNEFTNSNLGEAIWNHFLEKKFEDRTLLRRPWEIMESDVLAMEAIDRSLRERDSTFADELAEFAVWNYFTGDRADPVNFFEESESYPKVSLADSFGLADLQSVTGSSRASTFEYYKFKLINSGSISLTGSAENSENWKLRVIIDQPDGNVDVLRYDYEEISNGVITNCFQFDSEVIVIPIHTLVLDGDNLPLLSTTMSNFEFEIKNEPGECSDVQGISGIYPNPFFIKQQGEITFKFGTIGAVDFEVQIFTSDGRVLKTSNLADGTDALTPSSFSWDGRDNNNEMVASGIYIFQLKQDGFHQFKKFAVIHE